MSRVKHHIQIVLFVASLCGMFLSMNHYHSDGLECLDHVEDQHFTENEILCPICGITAFTEPVNPNFSAIFTFVEGNFLVIDNLFIPASHFSHIPPRAPPVFA